MTSEIHWGLEGIIVAETALSGVDGHRGRLILAGHDVAEVAARASFEATCALMLEGHLPDDVAASAWTTGLHEGRLTGFEMLGSIPDRVWALGAMDFLRANVAAMSGVSPATVAGALATLVAAWIRRRREAPPLPPTPIDHASDLLRMVHGEVNPEAGRALAAYLSTVVDHGMNASTFTARVIASTESDLVSAIVGALGALKGRLHGGAPGPVLDMLDAVEVPERADAWVADQLARGERIMGMGHRVYRVRDPRAAVLEEAVVRLAGDTPRVRLARAVEKAAQAALSRRYPDRQLQANVEFYTALLLEALHLPREAFTAIFACGRVIGWAAQVAEQRARGRLIRPKAAYVPAATSTA